MDRKTVSELSSPASSPTRTDLASIQYLRAAAAIAVLVFHAADRMGVRFGAGAAGVDVFFVISGFIMWVIGARSAATPLDFLRRRAQRIAPLYWLVTLGLAAAFLVAPGLFRNLQPTPGHVALSLAFVPHTDPRGQVAPLVEPGWTLNFEVFFYVVFAACLAVPRLLRLGILSSVLIGLTLLGAALAPKGPIAQTYTSPLLLEFLAGVWIGWAWQRGLCPGPRLALALLAAGVCALAALELMAIDIAPARALLWGAPAVAIVWGGLGLERAGKVPDWPAARLLGDASYSIYLVHGLSIAVALRVMSGLGAPDALTIAGLIAAGLAAGLVCYGVIERPISRLLHPRPTRVTATSSNS